MLRQKKVSSYPKLIYKTLTGVVSAVIFVLENLVVVHSLNLKDIFHFVDTLPKLDIDMFFI